MKFEYFLNRIYYSLFKINLFFCLDFMNKDLPLEKVVKFESDINTDYTRARCLRIATDLMTIFLTTGIVGVLNALKLFFIKVAIDSDVKALIILVGLFLLALPMEFYFLWRKDKYLAYFKRFEKESKRKTRMWCFITVVLYIAILILFFWSLCWLSK